MTCRLFFRSHLNNYMMENFKQPRYVDLRSDAGFKAVFADRNNRELLRQTLNLLLPEENAVEQITEYLDREQELDFIGGKGTCYDLICKGRDGRHFIVELQKEPQTAFFERCMYYCAGTYHGQLRRGDHYDKLCPVFLVGILNFKLAHEDESLWDSDHVVSEYQMIEKRTGEFAPPAISCIFAELGRFGKRLTECGSDRDVLFYMMQHGSVLEELPKELKHRPYAEALAEACEIAGFSDVKKQIYDEDMISERDIAAKCDYAFRQGEAKGEAKGKAEGMAEGMAKGKAEGEAKKAKAVAANLLAKGLPSSLIAECTGLSEDEVLSLKAD